jgi:hypothetical protein
MITLIINLFSHTFQSTDIVAPELGLVSEGRVLGVEVKMHLAETLVGHYDLLKLPAEV